MIEANRVMEILKRRILVDGFDIVIDFDKSHGSYIVDARNGKEYLDFYTFFGSSALGMNHPALNNEDFKNYVFKAAIHKVANSDIYTQYYAEFVDTLAKIATPDYFKHFFFIDGGALAVENALKISFDWKVRKNLANGRDASGTRIVHFKEAFHGRTGYTLSLTNTADPRKTMYFPKFDWPRITNPKVTFPLEEHIKEVEEAEERARKEMEAVLKDRDDVAALIIEPVQGEGGDNHFRKEFFQYLRRVCDENDILLIYDEVQSGGGITGKMWAHEHFDVAPDLLAFGKKLQVCGVMATERVDEVEKNCFEEGSRINSTWGGNLTDMARSTKILETIKEENLLANASRMGKELKDVLLRLQEDFPIMSNVRGLGLMCAFDLPDGKTRDRLRSAAFEEGLLLLGCGVKSVRFRPVLCVTEEEIRDMDNRLRKALKRL
ncbi:MAG: L-lysine 6-transaminase [Candidatus Thermoplasmatota archaeon]|nr:L-lysine 6-transaminase [Candidatus Thermoplasmatota archaeon]